MPEVLPLVIEKADHINPGTETQFFWRQEREDALAAQEASTEELRREADAAAERARFGILQFEIHST